MVKKQYILLAKIIYKYFHLYIKMQLSREEGIRTLDTLLTHTRFPSVRLKPLGHLSNYNYINKTKYNQFFNLKISFI